ncbi:MAG: hypothetical protein ABIL05_01155, partial [candidate division WOR-3 bacterium]
RILASKASYDVCPVSVENPRTGVRVDTPYTVRAKIRNQGMYTVSYPVYCYIRRRDNLLVYADTFLVTNHGINTDIQITFTPDWMPKDYDERFTITVITDLTNDNDRSNDTIRAYTNSYGLGEIAYDDFGPEAWIVVNSPNGPDDYLATRFTPFYAPPYYLTRFRIFVNSMTRLRDVKICPDSAGRPDLNRPFVQRNDLSSSTAPGWIDITFPAVTVSTPGDIWLTAHYYSGLIGPAVGADTNLPIDRRSYLSSNGGASWIQITNQDLIMRIFHRDTLATITEDQKTRIDQPLPNPVRSKLKIILPRCPGSLVFYDAQGRKVREIRLSGQDSYEWDLTDAKQQKLPAGIYFYQIALEKKKKMGKILLVR